MIKPKASVVTILIIWLLGQLAVQASPASQTQLSKVIIVNNSDQPLCQVYISPAASPEWGPNRLNDNIILQPGHQSIIEIPLGNYDIAATNCQNGTVLYQNRVNLSDDTEIEIKPEDYCDSLYQSGNSLYLEQKYIESITRFEESLQCYQKINVKIGQGLVFGKLGQIAFKQGDLQQAFDMFNQALALFVQEGDRLNQARILVTISTWYQAQGRLDEMLQGLEQALSLATEVNDVANEITIRFGLGWTLRELKRYDAALLEYNKLLFLEKYIDGQNIEEELVLSESTIYAEIGAIYREKEDYENAIASYEKAIETAIIPNDRYVKGDTLAKLGLIYHQVYGDFESALALYEQALIIFDALASEEEIASVTLNIADIYVNQRRLDDALTKYNEVLTFAQKAQAKDIESLTLYSIGLIYYFQERFEDALNRYNQALAIAKEVENPVIEGQILFAMANIYRDQNNEEEATKTSIQAVELMAEITPDDHQTFDFFPMDDTLPDQRDILYSQDENPIVKLLQSGDDIAIAELLTEAQSLLSSINDPVLKGDLSNNIGLLLVYQGHFTEALSLYEQALLVADQVGDHRGAGITLANIGVAYRNQGNFNEAITSYQAALAKIEAAGGDPELEAEFLIALKDLYQDQGLDNDAFKTDTKSVPVLRATGNREDAAWILTKEGGINNSQGRYGDALRKFEQALHLARDSEDSAAQAAILAEIASVQQNQKRYELSINTYEEALAIIDQIDDKKNRAAILNGLGLSYLGLALKKTKLEEDHQIEIKTARENFELAYDISSQLKQDPLTEATTLQNIGLTYLAENNLDLALEIFKQALRLLESSDIAPVHHLTTLSNIGAVYWQQARYDEALAISQQALEIAQTTQIRSVELLPLYNIAGVHFAENRTNKAIEAYQTIVDILEQIRARSGSEQARTSFMDEYASLYGLLVGLYLQQGEDKQAFFLHEQGRARSFLDSLASEKVILNDNLNADLLSKEALLYAQRENLQDNLSQLLSLPQPDRREVLMVQNQLTMVDETYKSLLNTIQSRDSQLATLIPGTPKHILTVEEVQSLLGEQTTLLSYHILDEKLLIFVLTNQKFEVIDVPVSQDELESQIDGFRDIIDFNMSNQDIATRGERLYLWLIEPVLHQLNTPQLIIVPYGKLHYLPFAALRNPEDNQYLTEEFTLTSIPSASSLPFVQKNAKNITLTAIPPLILGNPTHDLDGAEQEAITIASLYQTNPLLGSKATEAAVWESSAQAGILHIAAHGTYNPVDPYASVITLAVDEAKNLTESEVSISEPFYQNDGQLEVREIFGLDLKQTDLVVLSACQTQLGEISSGDDVVGLTRAFFFAGTPSVIATLWNVDDEATQFLMTRFYTYLQNGLGKAEALRQAQIDTMTQPEYANPFYWAGFVLSGDAGETRLLETIGTSSPQENYSWAIFGSILTLCLTIGFLIWRRHQSNSV